MRKSAISKVTFAGFTQLQKRQNSQVVGGTILPKSNTLGRYHNPSFSCGGGGCFTSKHFMPTTSFPIAQTYNPNK